MAFDNHCHVCFPELIENTKRGFETHIEKLGLTGIGLLSCPRTSHTGQEVDVLENLKILYLKQLISHLDLHLLQKKCSHSVQHLKQFIFQTQ